MSTIELNAKATTYFDLLAQIEELTAEAEAIKDTLRGVMVAQVTEELNSDGWRATWHNTTQSRFDSRRFRADHTDLYGAYTIKISGTRFTLNRLNV